MGVAASYASAAANEQSASNRIDRMRWSQPMHVTLQRDDENIMTRVGIGGHFYEVWGWPAFIQAGQWLLAMYAQQ